MENNTIIHCPVCEQDFNFDDSNIPVGEFYEVVCPVCGMVLRRKKVSRTPPKSDS